ncbi:MAG: DinB family protein [Pedobacter sp.]|nr:MAG: DinB family protein [Pedobacter sp.]
MTSANDNTTLVKELTDLILKGNAHAALEDAVADIPLKDLTVVPADLPYNIWQLTEHIRITQWDIVEFCLDPDHKSPKWPDEYWVKPTAEVTKEQWEESIQQIKADRQRFLDLLQAEDTDLFSPLPQGSGQNILREALLIADHTSYHLGELMVLRRLLHNWKS